MLAAFIASFAAASYTLFTYLVAGSTQVLALRNDLEGLRVLDPAALSAELRSWGFVSGDSFNIPLGASTLCMTSAPTFPRNMPVLDWMPESRGGIMCWDGAVNRAEDGTFWRVCHPVDGPLGTLAVGHLSTDLKGGTWEGGLLPEDFAGSCKDET
jgi:hypothetical protein